MKADYFRPFSSVFTPILPWFYSNFSTFFDRCEGRKSVIYTKSRHPCGCRLLDDRGCLSAGVSEGHGGLPEFRLGVDAVDEVTHGCGGSFAPCDGPLLLSGWEMTFGPDAATAPAVGVCVKIDEIRVQAPDSIRRSCCDLSAGVVCTFHVTLYLRQMPRFRVGKYTQHFCRISATSFPVTTHCEASVYNSVWIVVLRPEDRRLYVLSATKIYKFSHLMQVFLNKGRLRRAASGFLYGCFMYIVITSGQSLRSMQG